MFREGKVARNEEPEDVWKSEAVFQQHNIPNFWHVLQLNEKWIQSRYAIFSKYTDIYLIL